MIVGRNTAIRSRQTEVRKSTPSGLPEHEHNQVAVVMPMALNDIEEEVVFLKAIKEIIDSMVNFEMLTLHGTDPDSTVLFKTSTHQRFFNVVLVDFLSRTDKKAPVKQSSYLGALRAISARPSFSVDNSVAALRNATCTFVDWLEQKAIVDVRLPSINTQATIQISRLNFPKMCGDISKHNILRPVGVAEELQRTLAESGTPVELEDAMLALDDFYERFHTDILNYHSVWEDGDPPMYRYTYPKGVAHNFAKQCYWDLMNEVRAQPYVRRFEVTKWLKLRY
jgi:hypothetical protein